MFRLASAAVVLGCGGAMYAGGNPLPAIHAKGRAVAYQRDLDQSDLKIWLQKKGALSAVGHNLILKVHDWQSKVTMTPDGECELDVEVDTSSIQVFKHWKPAKEGEADVQPGIAGSPVTVHAMDAWSTGQIHGTMRAKDILDVAKYPKVTYHGKGVKKGTTLHFDGTMILKGKEAPLALDSVITVQTDSKGMPAFVMKGETMFLQTSWGITPLSQFMGSLQLKDEITAKWEVHFVAKEQ